MLSELILTAKIMRKKNLKIQMLAGNTLKIRVGAGFEISLTLGSYVGNSFCGTIFFMLVYQNKFISSSDLQTIAAGREFDLTLVLFLCYSQRSNLIKGHKIRRIITNVDVIFLI